MIEKVLAEKNLPEKHKKVKCAEFDFKAVSVPGLKVHMKRKLTITVFSKISKEL